MIGKLLFHDVQPVWVQISRIHLCSLTFPLGKSKVDSQRLPKTCQEFRSTRSPVLHFRKARANFADQSGRVGWRWNAKRHSGGHFGIPADKYACPHGVNDPYSCTTCHAPETANSRLKKRVCGSAMHTNLTQEFTYRQARLTLLECLQRKRGGGRGTEEGGWEVGGRAF